MAANSPVEYYLVLKKDGNENISQKERPEIKDMLSALMSMGNDRGAIFKLAPNKQNYIFDTELLETPLVFKKDKNYAFEFSAEKPGNASLYICVRVNADNICERISVVTEGGADYKVENLSSPLKTQLKETFQRSNYQQDQSIERVQIFAADCRIWASHKNFQENFKEKQPLSIDAIAKEDLPAMKTVNGDLIVGEIPARPGNPEVQSSITISYLESSKKVIGLTLHQPGTEDIVFDTDDLDAINSSDDPMRQMASLIDARIIATAIPTMAQAYHFYHAKGQSSTQFAYSDGFIVGPDVSKPYNFLINLKTNELRIHCKATHTHVTIPNFNIDANLSVLIQQFHTAFLSLISEEMLKDPMAALDLLIYICKEIISSRKQSKDEMFAQDIKNAGPNANAGLFQSQKQTLMSLKALVAKVTRLRNVEPLNQDGTINFELILLLDEIASDIEAIDIPEEIQSETVNPILNMRDTLLQRYITDILATIENMCSDNDATLKLQLMKITEALANLVKLEKINGYTAVFISELPRSPGKNIVYFIPEGGKIRFLVVDPRTNSPITGLLNKPADRDSLLMTTLAALSKSKQLPDEAVTNTRINQNITVLRNLLWGYTLHPISELPVDNNKMGNKIYIDKIRFGERYVVHMENGFVTEGKFIFNSNTDLEEFKDGINLDDSMAVLKFVTHRISQQRHSDIVIRSGAVIKESIVSAFKQIAVCSPENSTLKPAVRVPKSAASISPSSESSSPSSQGSSPSAESSSLSSESSSLSSESSSLSSENSSPSSKSSSPSAESSSSSVEHTSSLSEVSRSVFYRIQDEYNHNIEKITTLLAKEVATDVATDKETLKAFLDAFFSKLKLMLTEEEIVQTAALIALCCQNSQLLFTDSKIIHPNIIEYITTISQKITSPEATAAIRTVIILLKTNQKQKIEALTTSTTEEDVSLDKDYLNRFFAEFNKLLTSEEDRAVTELIGEIRGLPYLLQNSEIIHPQVIEMMVMVSERISSPTAKTAICTVIKHLKTNQQNKLAEDKNAKNFDSKVGEFSRFLNSLEGIIASSECKRSQEKSISADMNTKIMALKKEITRYLRFIEQNKWCLFGNIADAKKDFTTILDSIKQRLTDIQNTKAAGLGKRFMAFIDKDVEAAQAARQEKFSAGMTDLATELAKLSTPLTGDSVSLLNPEKKEKEIEPSNLNISTSVPSSDSRRKGRTLTIHSSMRTSPDKVQPFSASASEHAASGSGTVSPPSLPSHEPNKPADDLDPNKIPAPIPVSSASSSSSSTSAPLPSPAALNSDGKDPDKIVPPPLPSRDEGKSAGGLDSHETLALISVSLASESLTPPPAVSGSDSKDPDNVAPPPLPSREPNKPADDLDPSKIPAPIPVSSASSSSSSTSTPPPPPPPPTTGIWAVKNEKPASPQQNDTLTAVNSSDSTSEQNKSRKSLLDDIVAGRQLKKPDLENTPPPPPEASLTNVLDSQIKAVSERLAGRREALNRSDDDSSEDDIDWEEGEKPKEKDEAVSKEESELPKALISTSPQAFMPSQPKSPQAAVASEKEKDEAVSKEESELPKALISTSPQAFMPSPKPPALDHPSSENPIVLQEGFKLPDSTTSALKPN